MASSDFLEQPLAQFVERIAEETPAPGGGSTAAVVAAMAAGLVEMAARFSHEWDDAATVAAQAQELRARILPLAPRDAEAYASVLEAYRLPEEPGREAEIERALSEASAVPLEIAEAAAEVAALAARAAADGNPNLRGDATAGGLLAGAAARIAANLVAINLGESEDDGRVERGHALAAAAEQATGH